VAVGTAQFQYGPLSVGPTKLHAGEGSVVAVTRADDIAHLKLVGILFAKVVVHWLAPLAGQCATVFCKDQQLAE
jgi:hypothetical protein